MIVMGKSIRHIWVNSFSVALFNNIHPGGIVEGQDGGLFGSSPDGITVNATQLFDDNSPNLQTTTGMAVPVQLIPADLGSQVSSSEKVVYLVSIVTWVLHYIMKMSRDARKPVFGSSEQVRHKPTYTVTEES